MRILILFVLFLLAACHAQYLVEQVYNDPSCLGDVVLTTVSANCSTADDSCTQDEYLYGDGTSFNSFCEDTVAPASTDLVVHLYGLNSSSQCDPETGPTYYITPFACVLYASEPNPYARFRCRNSDLYQFLYPDNTCTGIGSPVLLSNTECYSLESCPQFDCQSDNVPLRMSMFAMTAYTSQTFNRAVQLQSSTIDGTVVISAQQNTVNQEWVLVEDLCLDAVVIVIRGSNNDLDWLANIRPSSTTWKGGYIHSGYYSRAVRIFNEIYEVYGVEDLTSRYSSLYITGHSSGAAVASILTRMFSEFVPGTQGYGFGTPRVATSDIDLSSNFISYVFETDIIPRLSLSSGLNAIQQCQDEDLTDIISYLTIGLSTGQSCRSVIELYASVSANVQFEIPGTILLSHLGDTEIVSSEDLNEILQSPYAFSHHSVEYYVNMLGGSYSISDVLVDTTSCPAEPSCVSLVFDLAAKKRSINVDFVAGTSYYCALTEGMVQCISITGDSIDTSEISSYQPRQIAVCQDTFIFVADNTVYGTDLQGTIQSLYSLDSDTTVIACNEYDIYALTYDTLTGLTLDFTINVPLDYTNFEMLSDTAVFSTIDNQVYVYTPTAQLVNALEFSNILDLSARSNVIAVLEPTSITVIQGNTMPPTQYTMNLNDTVLSIYVDASGLFVHALWANGHVGIYPIANETIVSPSSDSVSPSPISNGPSQQTPNSNNSPSHAPGSAPGSSTPSGTNTPGTRTSTPLNTPNQISAPSSAPYTDNNGPSGSNNPLSSNGPTKSPTKPTNSQPPAEAGKVSSAVLMKPLIGFVLCIIGLVL